MPFYFTFWFKTPLAFCVCVSQMPSSVFRSPEGSSGLLCLSLLNTDDNVVDETGDLIILAPGDMRCRQYVCNFSAYMWPKHFHRQPLENRE